MEDQILDTEQDNKSAIELSHNALAYLSETKKWAKFLSILAFIFLAFTVVLGFSLSAVISKINPQVGQQFPTVIVGLFYLAISTIYFFPILYLFKFSKHMGKALEENSTIDMAEAFSNLKSHYKFFGICAIIVLSIYGIALFFMTIGLALK